MRDVCVIGAGIIGTAVAYHLTQFSDLRVTIVDQSGPASGTTQAGTGWISARTDDAAYRDFRRMAMEEHRRLERSIPGPSWVTGEGTLLAADSQWDLESEVRDAEAAGFPVEILSADDVRRRLEPHVDFGADALRVAHFPSEFTVSGPRLTNTLYSAALAKGATAILGSAVTGLGIVANGRHRVHTASGAYVDADILVNAAGAGAQQLAELHAVPMPSNPTVGVSVDVHVDGASISRMVRARGVTLKPEHPGVIRVRGRQIVASDPESPSRDLADIVRDAVESTRSVLPGARIEPGAAYLGVRPYPADGLPRVGPVPSIPGYFEAVTHSGAVLAPLIGRLLAREIATGETSDALALYRPSRFLQPESENSGWR